MLGAPAWAQLDRSQVPGPGPAPAVAFPDYELVKTANGMRVILVKDTRLPVISLRLLIDRKPVLEGQFAGGLDIMGEMLVRGTTSRTKDQIDEDVDLMGARIGSGGTSVYASGLSRYTDKLFELAADVALHPSFPQDELDKIITQTISGLKHRKTEPTAIVEVLRQHVLFGDDHPYGEVDTEDTVKRITRDKCLELYHTYFKADRAILAVVGDFDRQAVLQLIERLFGAWQPGPIPLPKFPTPKPLDRVEVAFVDRPSSVQSVIRVCETVVLPWTSPNSTAVQVMNTVLGGGASFRLFENLREKHAYTYGAYTSIGPDELVSSFTASTSAKNPVTTEAITEIFKELKRLQTEPVSPTELERAKNYLGGGFVRSLESADTVAERAITIERFGLPKDHYKTYLRRLAAVNAADVLRVAKQYLRPDRCLVAVVGKAQEVKDKLKTFGPVSLYDEDGRKLADRPATAATLTPTEILSRFIAKTGGQAKLDALRDKTVSLSGKLANFDLKVKLIQKAPNKLLQEMSVGAMQQKAGFDGEHGWAVTPQGVVNLSGEQLESLKAEAAIDFYGQYGKLGYRAEVTGIKPVAGKDCYEITFAKPTAATLRHYFDTQSFLKRREASSGTSPEGPGEQQSDLSDYKDFGGYLVPTRIESTMMGQTINLTLDQFLSNTGVADELFQKPPAK